MSGYDNDNDNDNDNENNFIVIMKLHFHSLYKSDNIPNEDFFTCQENMYNVQCTGKKWL